MKKRSGRVWALLLAAVLAASLTGCGGEAEREPSSGALENVPTVSEAEDRSGAEPEAEAPDSGLTYMLTAYPWDREKQTPAFFLTEGVSFPIRLEMLNGIGDFGSRVVGWKNGERDVWTEYYPTVEELLAHEEYTVSHREEAIAIRGYDESTRFYPFPYCVDYDDLLAERRNEPIPELRKSLMACYEKGWWRMEWLDTADHLGLFGLPEPEGMLLDAEILELVWDQLGKPDYVGWMPFGENEIDDLLASMEAKERSSYFYDLIYEYPEYTLKLYVSEFVFDEYGTAEAQLANLTYYPSEAWELEKQMLLEDGLKLQVME